MIKIEDYIDYRRHPRILELRLTLIHSNLVLNLGLEQTNGIFAALCDVGRMNWTLISGVLARKDLITNLNTRNKVRYRQEIVFMGWLFGENALHTTHNYLRFSRRLFYEAHDGKLPLNRFLNEEWVSMLDYSVAVANNTAYALEIERFLNYISGITEVISGVPMAKV